MVARIGRPTPGGASSGREASACGCGIVLALGEAFVAGLVDGSSHGLDTKGQVEDCWGAAGSWFFLVWEVSLVKGVLVGVCMCLGIRSR